MTRSSEYRTCSSHSVLTKTRVALRDFRVWEIAPCPNRIYARELRTSVKKLLVVIRKEPRESDETSLFLDHESGYRVISAKQGEPTSLLARGKSIARWHPWSLRCNGNGRTEGCPIIEQDRGCVASWGQDHLAGNGAGFLLMLNSRILKEPMHEAEQMTTGNRVVQLRTRPVAFQPPRESAASQYPVGTIRFESGCVVVFHGGIFGCSSRTIASPCSIRALAARKAHYTKSKAHFQYICLHTRDKAKSNGTAIKPKCRCKIPKARI
jgi:hypothetical protein